MDLLTPVRPVAVANVLYLDHLPLESWRAWTVYFARPAAPSLPADHVMSVASFPASDTGTRRMTTTGAVGVSRSGTTSRKNVSTPLASFRSVAATETASRP